MSSNEPGQPATGTAPGMHTSELPTPRVALAIGAHPDDVEFGCGATLAKWADDGCIIHHLVCTDGSKGTWDADADISELVVRRQVEQREAARRLAGERAGEVVFLGHVDGELDSGLNERGQVAAVIRRLRPDVVLGHDPWKQYRLHPDHRHAGLLACDGVVAARDPHFYREQFTEQGLAHHRPEHLLLFEAQDVSHIESVAPWVDRKLSALEAHESQFESTMHAADEADLEAFRRRISERLAGIGRPYGLESAEAFARISDL